MKHAIYLADIVQFQSPESFPQLAITLTLMMRRLLVAPTATYSRHVHSMANMEVRHTQLMTVISHINSA